MHVGGTSRKIGVVVDRREYLWSCFNRNDVFYILNADHASC
jgi:hypothetical protein